MTIADVLAASDPIHHRAVVERWARGTWAAYAELQSNARGWVRQVDRQRGRSTDQPASGRLPRSAVDLEAPTV